MFCFAFDILFDFFTDAPDPSEGRSAGPEEVRFALPGGPWSRAVELAEGFGWLAVRSQPKSRGAAAGRTELLAKSERPR